MPIYGASVFRSVNLRKDKRIHININDVKCFICKQKIDPDEVCIKRNKKNRFYHKKCFENKYPNSKPGVMHAEKGT